MAAINVSPQFVSDFKAVTEHYEFDAEDLEWIKLKIRADFSTWGPFIHSLSTMLSTDEFKVEEKYIIVSDMLLDTTKEAPKPKGKKAPKKKKAAEQVKFKE